MADTITTETKELLPEVQAYVDATAEAERVCGAAMEEARKKYPHRVGFTAAAYEERLAYYAATDAAEIAQEGAWIKAWDKLKESHDPLVRWIAENCEDNRDEAEIVLKALPATMGQLDALAAEHDWCGEWNALRDRAINAGVRPGHPPRSAAHKAVLTAIDEEACCPFSPSKKRRISGLLDALVAEATAETPQAVAA